MAEGQDGGKLRRRRHLPQSQPGHPEVLRGLPLGQPHAGAGRDRRSCSDDAARSQRETFVIADTSTQTLPTAVAAGADTLLPGCDRYAATAHPARSSRASAAGRDQT